jgi:hypothetical protein
MLGFTRWRSGALCTALGTETVMADPGFTVSTDQDVSAEEDVDVIVHGCGAVPYVMDLDVEIEQHVEVEQVSEIDLDADDACAGLAVAVDVDQDAYLEQLGEVDIDIEEEDGLVSVDLEVDIVQTIRIEDAIRIDAEGGDAGDDDDNGVTVDIDQDVRTVQKLDLDIEIEDEVLALVNVDADQCAALFQGVDVLLDLSSGTFVVDVDTVQDADLDDSLVISFDIQDAGQVQASRAVAADDGSAGVEATQPGRVVGGFGSVSHGAPAGGSAVAGLAGNETVHGTGGVGAVAAGELPDGDHSRAGALSIDHSVAPAIAASVPDAESLRGTQDGGIVDLGDRPGAVISEARSGPDEGTIAVGTGTGAPEAGALAGDAITAMHAPAEALAAGLVLTGRMLNKASEAPTD